MDSPKAERQVTDVLEKLKVTAGVLSPSDIWNQKDEWTAQEAKNKEGWDKLPEQEREVTLEIVDRALDRMRDRLDEWVPFAVDIEQGQYLDVSFRILFTELEEELRARDEITQRRINESAEDTARILEELERKKRAGVATDDDKQE